MSPSRLLVTTGEPAGIGPDLVLQLAGSEQSAELVAVGCRDLLEQRSHQLGLAVSFREFDSAEAPRLSSPGELCVLDVPLPSACTPGQLNPANAPYVLELLDRSLRLCQEGKAAAMVTAPVQKSVINEAGIPFSGHTEYLAQQTRTEQVVMLLACERLRVALATTHLPLSEVPAAITADLLVSVLNILDRELRKHLGLESPRIAVLGLNPHAGENGHLGSEELEIIQPTLEKLRGEGMNLLGPLPADTAFNHANLEQCDAFLAMYHDQGLPVLKYAGFGQSVNVTLGLPIIRTSVDHGTALDLAGSGRADAGSLAYACDYALNLATRKA